MACNIMTKKISFNLGYQSPFAVFSLYSNQKDYRLAWLLNKNLGFELERLLDYTHSFSEGKTAKLSLFGFNYKEYRMFLMLIGNKSENGSIIAETPVPDYLLLFWNMSDFFNTHSFQQNIRKIQQIQTISGLSEKQMKKHEAFFYDFELFLNQNSII